jgi:hypothetical protein
MDLRKYKELPANLFGMLFWNTFSLYGVVFICLGFLALFGIKPVEFNGEPTYGILGMLISLIMTPVMSLVTAFAIWILMIAGNFIFKIFVKLKR